MKSLLKTTGSTVLLLFLAASSRPANSAPFDGKTFQGRIAYSADGNHNDEDDWAASPVALAIFAECGVKDRVVHFDYNCILPQTDLEWEKIHATSVLGAAERYGYNSSVFHDCRNDLNGAINSIAKAIDDSSSANPLYFIIAGPMEVPFLGIQKSDPAKRKFVYCISHSRWNDGFAQKYTFTHTKRSVIPSGVKWVQIRDQNQFLSTSPYGRPARPEEWRPWHWMRDSEDSKVRFLWERMVVSTRADCSDAGMAYFLMTGDEETGVTKLRRLLEDNLVPEPISARKRVRIEAENFLSLEGYALEDRNDRQASHRLNVKLADRTGRIQTPFDQPYTAAAGRYDLDVRYFDEKAVQCQFALSVNGVRQGAAWNVPGTGKGWISQTIPNVPVNVSDEILVEVKSDAGAPGRLDYVEFNMRGAPSQAAAVAHPGSNVGRGLDDPEALPGQVIVAGSKPGFLKNNGGGPVFLSGPDNPEEFLFLGTLNADGTRSGGGQEKMIDRMAAAKVNAFHCQMFGMQRCNFKKEGDDTHCPFVDRDPAKPLNEAVLKQWDGWLDR